MDRKSHLEINCLKILSAAFIETHTEFKSRYKQRVKRWFKPKTYQMYKYEMRILDNRWFINAVVV